MAIQSIPGINSSASWGGYIYGLNYQNGFTSTASTLTLSIINETGVYVTPQLNTSVSIVIGTYFRFNGYILTYNDDKKQNGQKILEVVLVDKSIILDRISVNLFKRGILGLQSTKFTKVKDIKVNNPNPKITRNKDGSYEITINPQEKTISISRQLERLVYGNFNIFTGGKIIIGEEQFSNSQCDIPDVKYNFSMLKVAAQPLLNDMRDIQPKYIQSYEGTLRQVLTSWCADFGFTFYWNASLDKLFFVDLRQGISVIPDVDECAVLSKSTSESLDGTFMQYAVAVYAKPINKLTSASKSTVSYIPFTFGPFGVDFLVGGTNNGYGGNRTQQQFINSCILSYYNSSLRKIYNSHFTGPYGQFNEVLGIKSLFQIPDDVSATILASMPNVLEGITAKFGTNYGVYLGEYDSSLEAKWEKLESDIASQFIGKYFKGLGISNSVIRYCTENLIYNYTYTVTPQGTDFDGQQNGPVPFQDLVLTQKQIDASNYKIFTRSGGFSHSQEQFNQALNIANYDTEDLLDYNFILIPLAGANISQIPDSIKKTLNLSDEKLRTYSLIVYPTQAQVKKMLQINFSAGRRQNRTEVAVLQPGIPTSDCQFKESELLCKTVEQEAREIAFPNENNRGATPPSTGLLSTVGEGLTISLGGQSVSVVAPADGNYQGYIEINESLEVLLTKKNIYKSYGDIGDGNGVSETRVIVQNITDDFFEDQDLVGLNALDVIKALTLDGSIPRKVIKYTTSDFNNSLPLTVESGLESLDITANDQGLDISYTYGNRPKNPPTLDVQLRNVESQFNRSTFAAQ